MVAITHYAFVLVLGLATVSNASNLRQLSNTIDMNEILIKKSSNLLAQVNQMRAEHGLQSLCSNKKLQVAAERHVIDQSKSDFMSDIGTDNSDPEQRVTAIEFNLQSVAENIDAGSDNASAVADWWMKGSNRDVILGEFTMVGTAYMFNEDTYNKHYWVQVYATGSSEQCD
ncbi:RxLR-like protein [Plasmopara halstedii]|uniref:RxLR-like protein n=1 Tax=Plasmopara halstedii TaxID=4781 RepID=A0A0P1AU76_PLAHL|nr:RxLR-like protein [Plasmopara halstedii]CEG44942.1 RxLR-like protein [Plasmopara halstedii]|eukprot:XP_024581311.1 RxLR-like protein [Plasmopara halstedii]